MSKTVIRVENLSKYYRLGVIGGATFREELSGWWARRLGRPDPYAKIDAPDHDNRDGDHLWALRDINLEVREGEVLGIIGRNGAGKSTLLKILSRITAPTSGRAVICGRLGSLLEVGTGFHPELTGRENIYLNGTILGMTRAEVDGKLEEIVEFSEINKFIDTPVKRYSSGMTVRLAFAVAAHMEPEILVVDEVLAVGDVAFQNKCLGKMKDVSNTGRTVLFVSHYMPSVKNLCSRAILISQGIIEADSDTSHVVKQYMGARKDYLFAYCSNKNALRPHLIAAKILETGKKASSLVIDKPISMAFQINMANTNTLSLDIRIRNSEGIVVYHGGDEFSGDRELLKSSFRECTIPPHMLAPGEYSLDMYLHRRNEEWFEKIENLFQFEVIAAGLMAIRKTGAWQGITGPGLVHWRLGREHEILS